MIVFVLAAWSVGFVVVTALCGAVIELDWLRVAIGVLVTIVLPAIAWRRSQRGRVALVALSSLLIGLALSLGFADDVGRALRRHGDWFLGERNGAVVRALRVSISAVADRLETFDPPRDLEPTIVELGPSRPDEPPPTIVAWFHPLAGAERALPMSESRRFGAVRPQPRPSECELGHCGVDLGYTLGQAVVAIHDGVIERIELDEHNGGRAGRYIRMSHDDGTLVSRYIHLDSVRGDLRVGMTVRGGELIGRVGHTGIEHAGPHLHFGLSRREHGVERYLDPEPLLRRWALTMGARIS